MKVLHHGLNGIRLSHVGGKSNGPIAVARQKLNCSIDFVLRPAGNTDPRPCTGEALGNPKVNAAGASYNEDRTIVKINVKGQGWLCAIGWKTVGRQLFYS
jgi:hypothetical protein